MDLKCLFEGVLDLSGWTQYSTKEDYAYDDMPIPGLRQEAYERAIGGEVVSVGVFSYYGVPAYLAWGLKSAVHCSIHAPIGPGATVGDARPGCPRVTHTRNAHGTVNGFILDGKERFDSGMR